MPSNYKIILASGSPRRQQFFKDFDFDFEVRLKEVEEIYPDHLKVEEITNYLAELKAKALLMSLLRLFCLFVFSPHCQQAFYYSQCLESRRKGLLAFFKPLQEICLLWMEEC